MYELFYTCFTKLIIAYFFSCNKNIPHRSNSEMHNEGDNLPITRLSNTIDSKFKFGIDIPATMINDAFKKTSGYKYYKAKKEENEKAKVVEEPEEHNISLVRSGRGKGYMRSGENEANVPKLFKKNVVPRKTRSLTVAEETVAAELAKSISIKEPRTQHRRRSQLRIDSQIDEDVADTYTEWGQKLKGPTVDDLAVQSLLDLQKGSKASRLKSLKQKKQPVTGEVSNATHTKYYDNLETNSDAILYSDTTEESANETDDADESDMDLTDDNLVRDDDAVRYGVFMYNKTTQTPNSTYISPMITSSSLDFIQTLLDETPINKLIYLMSHPAYTDAHTTSVVHNPEGNHEARSFQSGKSSHIISTSKYKIPSYQNSTTKLTLSQSKEADAKDEKEYEEDQLQKGTFEKAFQARVLIEIKKLLHTHIPKAGTNYVRPRLNTSVLEVMQNNQISLFTKSSTYVDDLLDMELKLKLLNKTHENKTHPTNQKVYDMLYDSILLDQEALDAQEAEPSFLKRSQDY
ncbi:hypothetical protein Tco_0385609 [Tanacetum coccineum]